MMEDKEERMPTCKLDRSHVISALYMYTLSYEIIYNRKYVLIKKCLGKITLNAARGFGYL